MSEVAGAHEIDTSVHEIDTVVPGAIKKAGRENQER